MRHRRALVAVAGCLLFAAGAIAQANLTITFATLPDGTQVPSSDVSTANFAPGSVLGGTTDYFSSVGVAFTGSGQLLEFPGGSTYGDGWCPAGGYSCAPNNVVVVNSPSSNDPTTGAPTLDALRITFVAQRQQSVYIDIDNGYLGESPSTTVQLRVLGILLATLTLSQGNEIAACPGQSIGQLCGRFKIADPQSRRFDEIDILPTTLYGAPASCTITTSGFAGSLNAGATPPPNYDANCGGSLIDNLTFNGNATYGTLIPVTKVTFPTTVCAGSTVILDGSGSTGNAPLTYSWTEVSNLVPPTTDAKLSFIAPNLSETLTFIFTVTDVFGATSLPAAPQVTIKKNNQAPVAQALINGSPSGTVTGGSTVMLDGTASYDPDLDPITYQWTQTGGPVVTLTNPTGAKPAFTAPPVAYPGSATLTFSLTTTDAPSNSECGGPLSSPPATATVNVTGVNHAPVAEAGAAQTVVSTSPVTLNGSSSFDPDGDPVSYSWTQTGGTPVTLMNSNTPMPTFMAPDEAPLTQETLTFQLTVTDQPAPGYPPLESSATVNVTVRDPYAAPACDKALASIGTLWPPDHRMVGPLSVINTTDNAPGHVTIATTSIFQDEPTAGTGSGDTAPDAKINSDGTFLLRAERAGTGDGRVYHISFTASNAYGGTCTGVVTVCVPHDMGKGAACVDQGSLYDSTQ